MTAVTSTNGARVTTSDATGVTTSNPSAAAAPPQNPTQLRYPAFLLNFPFSLSASVPNNVWMEELAGADREVDRRRATNQFLEVYRYVSGEALVYLLPTPRECKLQDLVYTANLGIVLEHLPDRPTAVLSNFTSEPRRGETEVGVPFFRQLGYDVHVAPAKFEGEAELKHLHDNVYVGGYGIRSERETYDWMEQTFEMEVVKLRMKDEYLYHLDCTIFPITREDTLVCTDLYDPGEIAELERHTNIIPVSLDEAYAGICNSVRLSNVVLNSSHIHNLDGADDDYKPELAKNRRLVDIAADLALEVKFFDLSEYHKSGALLSCMIMHLNRFSFAFTLV